MRDERGLEGRDREQGREGRLGGGEGGDGGRGGMYTTAIAYFRQGRHDRVLGGHF